MERRSDPYLRDFVDWIINQVLFHDMRPTEARQRMNHVGVPDHVFQRLLGVPA